MSAIASKYVRVSIYLSGQLCIYTIFYFSLVRLSQTLHGCQYASHLNEMKKKYANLIEMFIGYAASSANKSNTAAAVAIHVWAKRTDQCI